MRRIFSVLVLALCVAGLPHLASAQSRRGTLRVQINSTPSGAAIYIDGEEQSSRTTSSWVDLRRGTHQVRLVLDGHEPLEEEIDVRRAWTRYNYTLQALGRLELTARDETATGATVAIDGEEVGTLPLSHQLRPGRYSVRVSREGYHAATRWFELSAGQRYATDVALRPLPPPQGEILVAADVTGAEVLLDGTAAGTVPTILETAPGEHTVEVRAEGYEAQQQTVTVVGDSRLTVNVTLRPERAPGGTLLVLTVPVGATVVVDGEARGAGPVTVEELPPGTHIVEVRREGYVSGTERVVVEEGRQATVRLELQEVPRTAGLRVTSSVADAEVLLDDRVIGRTPLSQSDIEPGEHRLVVRAPGHSDWERRLVLQEGVELLVEATPDGTGRINVAANVEGAEVLIDGAVVGNVPLTDHQLASGDHSIEIRADGRTPFTTTITVDPGATNNVSAQLAEPASESASTGSTETTGGEGAEEEDRTPDRSGPRFTRSGFPPPPGSVYIDAAWGWPYLIGNYRIGVGIWDGVDWARMDIALEARSSYWLTEIELRWRFGTRFARVMRVGAELGIGVAIGQDYEETTENRAGFVLNLLITEGFEVSRFAFGLSQRLEFFVDTHGEQGTDLVRQVGARIFVGGFFEVSIHRHFHVFVLADYAPVLPSRRIMCASAWDADDDTCNHSYMRDINLNVQAGLGVRFN